MLKGCRTISKVVISLALSLMFLAASVIATTNLQIILYTTKPSYWLGDAVPTYGYLEANGSQVRNGIVCLEVDTPQSSFSNSHPLLFRTLATGTFSHSPQTIEVTQFFSSDQNGVRTNLTRGNDGYFTLNITNHNSTQLDYSLTVTAFDALKGVIGSSYVSTTIQANRTAYMRITFYVSPQAPMGTAIAFVNVFSKLPKQGGTQIAWERNCTFAVLDPNLPPKYGKPPNLGALYNGEFSTNFTIPKYQTWGNYSFYTSARYAKTVTTAQKTVLMRVPDVNNDGRVNILDLISVATKLGWTGTPGIIPQDLNKDGKVNILDLITVASWLGWVHPY